MKINLINELKTRNNRFCKEYNLITDTDLNNLYINSLESLKTFQDKLFNIYFSNNIINKKLYLELFDYELPNKFLITFFQKYIYISTCITRDFAEILFNYGISVIDFESFCKQNINEITIR